MSKRYQFWNQITPASGNKFWRYMYENVQKIDNNETGQLGEIILKIFSKRG